ncbi:MAG: RluA family pseudouridine synthase [Acidobacteria bacterium]|nr:RluA family pseudouridine synthase [Acidobacteriota bacterium]
MTRPATFSVEAASAGLRLDEFLAGRLAELSRMRIASMVARGGCAVNGAQAHAGLRLRAGDVVEVEARGGAPNSMTPEAAPLDIVHEDEHLLVVVKPAGVLVHPTLGVKSGTLANALAYHLNRESIDEGAAPINHTPAPGVAPPFVRPGLVHRLDRDTSGLLAVARTQAALSRLSQHFQRRLVEKRYVAVVSGLLGEDRLTLVAPIGRDEGASPPWGVLPGGKPAETRLRVLERSARRTLVELEPVTGRTNQLRIHCAHAGHPVVGDRLYGGEPHARLCLHAARLSFRHPATNVWVEFVSEAPAELLSALA